ncbi:TetR/AcrR family transcriptional regulator [Lysinibacter cavernae]|uniref:AcrR family transcriptional regulator n=1 Tax=Lysinibacter cavernae TaxID=1640652 RepID=A0A7X5R0L3_9MICO|nr:TetR/AcrR family transcriptional regulator [Lysinibacter cavernae]NIH53404.1 AcrR family transcriptional regulator [Lysinibacter cavernae]
MPKVSEEYKAERRAEIAAAALRCFARKGFQATSMAEIIAETGLSAGAIYGHYASKDDLVVDCARYFLGNRVNDLARLKDQRPLPQPGQVAAMFIAGFGEDLGDFGILVQVWGEAVSNPKVAELIGSVLTQTRTVYEDYLAEWFRAKGTLNEQECVAKGIAFAPVIVSLCQGYMVQGTVLPDFDGEAYLATLLDLRFD